ncbi:MAG: aldehyde dehydrogenase family protein, partial [Thermostichales cyanobacterium BF3_bins_165]
MSLVSRNPATGEVLQTFAPLTSEQIRACIDRADQAWQSYRLTPIPQRCSWLRQTAHLLRQHQEKYAALISLEMGKTLASARAEVEKSAWV